MNRRGFLSILGIGAAVTTLKGDVAAPKAKKYAPRPTFAPKRGKGKLSSLPEHYATDYKEAWEARIESSPSKLYAKNMSISAKKRMDDLIIKAIR